LQEEVEFWQGQYADCKEQMEGFLKQTDVVTFEDGLCHLALQLNYLLQNVFLPSGEKEPHSVPPTAYTLQKLNQEVVVVKRLGGEI
jgi:hypothetical protein